MGKKIFRYKHFFRLKNIEPFFVELPVGVFMDTFEQKWHLRWQCVIVPSRSPDVCVHAADTSRKWEEWLEEEKKNKRVGLFAQQTESFRCQKRCQLNQ